MDSSNDNCKRLCPEHEQILEQHCDWLGDLPPGILLHILSFLDMTEVVKTSLLSRKWRHIWTAVPRLNFDFRGFWKQEHNLVLSYNACLSYFWEIVKWVLINRDTSSIDKLQLLCDYYEGEQLMLLLSFCALRNVEELHLLVGYEFEDEDSPCCDSEPVLGFFDLETLVNWQPLGSFGNLKTLQLVNVRFPHADVTERLFSDCGILENLSLEYCSFEKINVLNISAHKLRKLNFVNDSVVCCGCWYVFVGKLKVHTPNLVSFCYTGHWTQPCEFSSDMPFFNHASIHFYPSVRYQKLGTMVSQIHGVKELSLTRVFVKYFSEFSLGTSCCKFNYLRRLNVELFCNSFLIEGLINLLKLTPNLEVLCIKLFLPFWNYEPPEIFWKSREEDVPCLSNWLREIEISNFHDAPCPLELAKFFLQNSKSLEKMKIVQSKRNMMNLEKLYALREVQFASEAIFVSVTSFSASRNT